MCVKMNLIISFLNDIYEFYNIVNMKIESYKRHIEFKR